MLGSICDCWLARSSIAEFASMARTRFAILKGSVLEFVEVLAMALAEVLPEVQALTRLDKIRLIQFLAHELEQDDDSLIDPGRSYPIWSPDQAFSAAAALLQALEEDKGQS